MSSKSMTVKILLVEDEIELANSLGNVLRTQGYQIEIANDGQKGWDLVKHSPFDLLILDWMLPYKSGLEICKDLRALKNNQISFTLSNTPVLFLTAKDTLDDRVLGLDAGADDYLMKPFELRELLARVRALLRRGNSIVNEATTSENSINNQILKVDDLELDIDNQLAYRHGRLIKLSEKEIKLLEFFLTHLHQLVTHEQIYQYLWSEDDSPSSNVVAAVVRLLRRKIEKKGEKTLIHTIYGKGYWFGLQEDNQHN